MNGQVAVSGTGVQRMPGPVWLGIRALPVAVIVVAIALQGCSSEDADRARDPDERSSVAQWDTLFGLVTVAQDSVCLTTAPGVRPPAQVTIIRLSDGRVATAELVSGTGPCPGDVSGSEGVSFRLRTSELTSGDVGVAVLTSGLALRGGKTDLDGNGELESYRQCTSREGVHVTVWAGAPLSSPRVWHAYHQLGNDTEPNCTDADVAEPSRQ